ncbi:MAG TPA: hypothetical protein VEB66_14500 [Opitutaceae bacterium]|nr:hypothetical protein [Opitutaceae bacterium]
MTSRMSPEQETGGSGSDWEGFLRAHSALGMPEVELAQLGPGDRLIVETLHTRYGFEWRANGEVALVTNRADRPSGMVSIQGCAFGRSSSIKPGSLFCGGNLEYVSDEGRMRHRTTAIRSLVLLRRGD